MSLNSQGLFCDIPIQTVYPRWTVDELKYMIALLKRAGFDFTFEASLQGDNKRVYGARQTQRSPFRLVKSGDVHPRLSQVIPGYHRLSLT